MPFLAWLALALVAAPAASAARANPETPPLQEQPTVFWLAESSQTKALKSGYIRIKVRAERDLRLLLSARIQKDGLRGDGPRVAYVRVAHFKAGQTRTLRLRLVGRGRKVLAQCVRTHITLRVRWIHTVFRGENQKVVPDHRRCAARFPDAQTPSDEAGAGAGGGRSSTVDPDSPAAHDIPPLPDGRAAPARTRFGLHQDLITTDPESRAKAAEMARNYFHAEISRTMLPWYTIEQDQGQPDWSAADDNVNRLTAGGIEPLLVLIGSPKWANGFPGSGLNGYWVPRPGPAFDAFVAKYAEFARQAATRYRGRVFRWEVWNEQNQGSTWQGSPPDPVQYFQLYRAVRASILSVDPRAQVAIGGLAGLSYSGSGTYSGIQFLRTLHQNGLDDYGYVSIHPYSHAEQSPDDHWTYENNFDDIGLIHDYLASIGSRARIWVTEFGWDSTRTGEPNQAAYTKIALRKLRTNYAYVDMALVFVDRDLLPRWHQGLFNADWTPKPAAQVYRDFLLSLPR